MEENTRDKNGRFVKGHKPTDKMIEKIRISHLGKTHSEETKKKISKNKKGCKAWNRGIPNYKARGENHHNWKGGKMKDRYGYIYILKSEHPYRNKRNYIFEHRLIMEMHLGRYLEPTEIVHHINGKRDDNRIENLELIDSHSKHMKKHFRERNIDGTFI